MKTKFCGQKYNFRCNCSQKKISIKISLVLFFFIRLLFFSFLRKKVKRQRHISRSVQVKKNKKSSTKGNNIFLAEINVRNIARM